MAKMFDKVSQDFLSAIKGVLEAKKLDPVGKENDDNDGDVDKSDKYLHNRRKAIKSAMMKKESAEQIDELSTKTLRSYRAAARDDAHDADAVDDERRLRKRSAGHNTAGKKIIKRGDTLRAEEVENLDELSKQTLATYAIKAKNQMGKDEYRAGVKMGQRHFGSKPDEMEKAHNARADKRHKGLDMALNKLTKEEVEQVDEKLSDEAKAAIRHAAGGRGAKVKPLVKLAQMAKDKKTANEEVEQIDELSNKTLGSYVKKAAGHVGAEGLTAGLKIKSGENPMKNLNKALKRQKGIATATDKLTKEEIEMIEAKLAGVAAGSMEGDKHMCATKVFHKEWKEGTPIKTMHADPDADGLIEWYDVMFDHGIERVMTEEMEILQAESHMHSKRKMKEETEELDEARGRPKKAAAKDYTVHPKTKEKLMHNNPEHMKRIEKLQTSGALEKPKTEAGQHIINQLRKASTSMQGGATVHFTHGESKHVTAAHAGKALDKYASMKPSEKEDYQKKIGHSHEQLMKHI